MKYYIDGSMIKAVVDNAGMDMEDFIYSNLKRVCAETASIDEKTVRLFIQNYTYPLQGRKYTGVSICSKQENFNEEKGKRIARARALHKYYRDAENIMHQILNDIYKLLRNFEDAATKAGYRRAYYNFADKLADDPDFLAKGANFKNAIHSAPDCFPF